MEKIATKVNDKEAEEYYKTKQNGLAEKIIKICWSEDKGCVVDNIFSDTIGEASNALSRTQLFLTKLMPRSLVLKRSMKKIP